MKLKTIKEARLNGVTQPVGAVVELDNTLGQRWIDFGLATVYVEDQEPEKEPDKEPDAEPGAEPEKQQDKEPEPKKEEKSPKRRR